MHQEAHVRIRCKPFCVQEFWAHSIPKHRITATAWRVIRARVAEMDRQTRAAAHLLLSVEYAGKLHHALATDAPLHGREEVVAAVEWRLHAEHRIQRHLQLLCRRLRPVRGPACMACEVAHDIRHAAST